MTTLIPKIDFKNGGSTPTGAVNRAINLKMQEIVSVKDFGAAGDGTTNDTTAITNAINYVNSNYLTLTAPDGVYLVTAGTLPTITTSFIAPTAFFKAADLTDSYLLALDYTGAFPSISNDTAASVLDIGGFADSTGSSYKGTGLLVKGAARAEITVRKAINLNYGVYIDGTNNPTKVIFENIFNLKIDSCNYNLYIATGSVGVDIDANTFNLGSSFNPTNALVTIAAGTIGVHNNVFNTEILELGQTNSNGYVFNGATNNNRVFIYGGQRGLNGTGKYLKTDSNASNNFWYVAEWVPTNNSFGSLQQVNALDAGIGGLNPLLGRSLYFSPDVVTAVGTNIPSTVGDIIFRSNPGIGDNLAWVCTTAGIFGSGAVWTAMGMKATMFSGMTDAVTGVSASTTAYFPVMGSTQSATSNNVAQQTSSDGVLRYFRVRSNAAPSAGQSFVFTLVKNGTPTAITLTISGTSTSASDLTSTLAVTAGDTLNWKVVSSGGTPANAVLFGSFEQLVDPS